MFLLVHLQFSSMADSTDDLDIIPDLCSTNDATAIPLQCWQDIRLCDIWIPSRLLPNRTKPSNTRVDIVFKCVTHLFILEAFG